MGNPVLLNAIWFYNYIYIYILYIYYYGMSHCMVFLLTNIDIFHGKMMELNGGSSWLPCVISWDEMGMTSVMLWPTWRPWGISATIFIRQITWEMRGYSRGYLWYISWDMSFIGDIMGGIFFYQPYNGDIISQPTWMNIGDFTNHAIWNSCA